MIDKTTWATAQANALLASGKIDISQFQTTVEKFKRTFESTDFVTSPSALSEAVTQREYQLILSFVGVKSSLVNYKSIMDAYGLSYNGTMTDHYNNLIASKSFSGNVMSQVQYIAELRRDVICAMYLADEQIGLSERSIDVYFYRNIKALCDQATK